MEVDLGKPLISKYKFKKGVRRVKYEGLHLICFNCGCYSHREDTCPTKLTEQPLEEKIENGDRAGEKIQEVIRPEVVDPCGPWMLVSKPRTNRNGNQEQKNDDNNEPEEDYNQRENHLNNGLQGLGSNIMGPGSWH